MKLAICLMPDKSQCSKVIEKMVQAQTLLDSHTSRLLPIAGGIGGCIHTSDRFSNIPLFREEPGGSWLLVTGIPIVVNGDLDEKLQKVVTGDYKSASRSLSLDDLVF